MFQFFIRRFSSSQIKKDKASSKWWISRQARDVFVKQAVNENFRCRSAFKLIQINEKFGILEPGFVALDCGAAPGSWCQVAVKEVNALGEDPKAPNGIIIGVDLKYISPVAGAHLLSHCDFTAPSTQAQIKDILKGRRADVILSDMAPSATGIKSHNHAIIVDLCFNVLRFSLGVLKERGTLLCKTWTGSEQNRLQNAMRSVFSSVKTVKPGASREDSAEIFLLCRGFKTK